MVGEEIRFARVNVGEVPPRLRSAHLKSRLGCPNCKKRKIKCDEGLPTCGPCEKRNLRCAGASTSRVLPRRAKASPVATVNLTDQRVESVETSPSAAERCHLDLQQLRIFHHFVSKTVHTLVLGSACWTAIVPLALEHDYLMHALLTNAAAHLCHLNPAETRYKNAEMEHAACATSGLREALSARADRSNVEATFAACILLYNQAWTSFDDSAESADGLQPAVAPDFLVPLGAGLKELLVDSQGWVELAQSPIFGQAVAYSPKVELLQLVLEHATHTEGLETQFRREYLRHWPQDECTSLLAAYMTECLRLVPVFSVLRLGARGIDISHLSAAVARYLYSWPMILAPSFVGAIRRKELCSQLLFWHYYKAVEVGVAQEYWWAQKRARVMLDSLQRRLLEHGIQPLNFLQEGPCC